MDIEKLKEQAQQALDSGDLETAKDLLAKIKEAKESKETDDQLKKDLADELKELDEETKATEIQEAKPKEQQAQSEKQESTEPTSNTNPIDKKDKEEKRSMEVILNDKKETYTRSINQFIRTKGEKRDGLTTVGAEAVIPVDRITKPEKQPETVVDLRQHVGRVPVTTGTGSYPILRANKNKMTSVDELAKNPALANPEFTKVNYEITTYRGYIPVSQEALDDSDIDLGGLVAEHIQRQSLNTSNAAIAAKLQTATAKTVTDIDGLKDIVNVTIDPAYNVKFIASQSFFNELDKMKDNDGRYLLQQDVTVASGYKLLGREVVVMADDVIGTAAGNKVAFVGDPSLFVKFFDRQQASVRWVDNDVYGQLLAGFVRFDVQVADNAAGFYVTLGPKG
ncbi:TPA: phage major capsid protein [Enterococcus faecium]|uniref:phage major capsid protein n=1 Tax=Enterococcus faecium TaxID=1352 RepID=UPI0002A20B48|nr:phage major capsid protein [Enterococcus faecium]VTQ86365.1 phage major capsid protein, HK97 family [Enterococcus hirae]ELA87439.1 HK97 family phage major capsid protein [Enterococcus faecium EnGen0016]HAQ4792242.1 phage major capsid protein [Enterococcus faecium]HAQ5466028.1 phage major capsid protein [Enterococcus faecium]HAQ5570454.1 phage major capsid protein [Enterococcus faecium]